MTSLAFQRWTCCITVTILFWSSLRVIYWLSHTPTIYGVLSLVLPLLLLPLLASAYAEVNYEGIKVLQVCSCFQLFPVELFTITDFCFSQ